MDTVDTTELDKSELGAKTKELYGLICSDVTTRQRWLTRQTTWYAMRHDGLRRRNVPWPGAADLHDPLADTMIDKLKPFYVNQLFGTEVIAQFIAKDPAMMPFAQDMGYWFDWKLKQTTNLETEILIGVDKMLMTGHVPFKVGWDADENRLYFDAIEPTLCIVPDNTENLEKADRVTIVHHMTPDAYRRDPRFKRQDDAFIKLISGTTDYGVGGSQQLRQAKEIREGITHGAKDSDLVIIWEVWEQTVDDGWWVHFFSPMAADKPVRASQNNPFTHGKCPIVRFDVEVKDKGWYASRGIVEKVAPYESYSSMTWNNKADAMVLYNTPIFTSASPIPNAGNMRMRPGQIMAAGLQAIQFGRPPISFDDEMNSTRAVAETNIGIPDYGIGDQNDKQSPRTATEVKAIGTQSGVGVELRARTFRLPLGRLLQLAWETLVQYDKDTQFYVANELKKLPPEIMQSGGWNVQPNGSSETWNKPQQMQKAVVRMQMFGPSQGFPQGMPWINQPELAKSVLELDDPRLVSRLFVDPNQQQQNEYDDESKLMPTLLLGMSIKSGIGQDQVARIKSIMDFMRAAPTLGHKPTPPALAAIDARLKEHLLVLKQKDPQKAQQIAAEIDAETAHHAGKVVPMPEQAEAPALATNPIG